MKYPLEITGKVLAVAPQFYVRDADGQLILYIRQKLFAFKEKISLFRDEKQTDLALSIQADRIIDFSANYSITDTQGVKLGSIRRQGMRSIWRASYEVTKDQQVIATLTEIDPWKKVIDNLLGEIPIIGTIISMLVNPSFMLKSADGQNLYRITKEVSFLERKFKIHREGQVEGLETLYVPCVLMMILLEGNRG
jgi:uncharacterized protein YxjI